MKLASIMRDWLAYISKDLQLVHSILDHMARPLDMHRTPLCVKSVALCVSVM
jgi:hypothetical protein